MSQILSLFLKTIRNSLLVLINKEFLIFLYFLLLSGAFWLGLTLNETVEREIPMAVKLTNVPSNVIITTDITDTIIVTVRDKGFALLPYVYGDKLSPVALNFATYANKSIGRGFVPVTDIQKSVQQMLYASSKITQIKPERLDFFFNYGASRRVEIKLSGQVTASKNHYIANVRFWPEKVTVYANEAILDSIKAVYTEEVNFSNISDTLFQVVQLTPIRGAKIVPSSVHIGIYADILTEAFVDVPITAVNMPKGKLLRTFPTKVRVHFTVGANMYRNVSPSMFRVIVDYNDIADAPSDKCRIRLVRMPSFVSLARPEIHQVDYLVEQQ